MDPLAEKYYHLSPYAYCAGDPVNLVDPDGRKIVINDGTKIYTWKNIDNQWGFYDAENNLYSGNIEYVNEYSNALMELLNTNTGNELVMPLANDEDFIVELLYDEELPTFYNDINKTINWKYKNPESVPTTDGRSADAIVNLAHELAHALYHMEGNNTRRIWYFMPTNNPEIAFGVKRSEIYVTHFENKLRAEKNLPLRTYYSDSRDQFGILHPIIKDGKSLYYNISGRTRFRKIYRKKNRFLYN